MPIGTITMVLANVGLQIYNNWCGSRQNEQLRQKREEFEQAALERNTKRMWQIMREGQALTLELEEQKHQQRLKDLQGEVDNLLHSMAYSATINNWPLNVLPIVMKNQALGNLLAQQEETIALHCILTPSNSYSFNTSVFPLIEEALETYCNQHWSIASDHPILFYSGAWKSNTHPTEVQIASMRTALSNLPTLLITPEFRPTDGKLVFQVRTWGVGASSSDEFSVPEIEPTEFQRDYTSSLDYAHDSELASEMFEDLVPYLQCLIGYMTDTYFWSSLSKAPVLPRLLTDGSINTDGMKYLVESTKGNYERMFVEEDKNTLEQPFEDTKALSLYDGTSCYYQEDVQKTKLEEIFISYCSKHTTKEFHSIAECLDVNNFTKEDLPFIRKFHSLYNDYQKELEDILSILDAVNFDYSILESTDIDYLDKLANEGNGAAMFRLGEIYEYSIGCGPNSDKNKKYYDLAYSNGFILAKFKYAYDFEKFSDIKRTDVEMLRKMECVQASIFMSMCHYYGIWLKKSSDDAMRELEQVEENKHPLVTYWAAQIVLNSYGLEQKELYIELLTKSADLNYVQAQLDLMYIYENGEYSIERPDLAFEYVQKASLQGDNEALLNLGIYYLKGYYVRPNKAKAKELIKMAAEHGNVEAISIIKRIKS